MTTQAKEPLINRKRTIRIAIGLFLIAGLAFAFQWWKSFTIDPDLGTVDTQDWIAAVENTSDGSQVVVFKADGTKIAAPGFKNGHTEREPVWRPDGNRLFFVSDREGETFNVYRWNLAKEQLVERRSIGSRSKGNLSFSGAGPDSVRNIGLITSGGFVQELDPRETSTRQVLPPVRAEIAQASREEGGADQFKALYDKIGTSFKKAKWGAGRDSVVAVMKRDDGEVLIVQNMNVVIDANGESTLPAPHQIMAGRTIDFDVDARGRVVASIVGFQFVNKNDVPRQYIKNGVATPPYQHAVITFETSAKELEPKLIGVSADKTNVLARPRISPDGQEMLILAGTIDSTDQFAPQALLVGPIEEAGARKFKPIAPGEILDSEWHPSGTKVVLTRREGKIRPIYTVNTDGSNVKPISGQEGSFSAACFSPQLPRP